VDLPIGIIRSRMRLAATTPKSKNNRFADEGLRAHFAVLLANFHGKIQALKGMCPKGPPDLHKWCVWSQENEFATTLPTNGKPPSAWLGFGEVYGSFRRPVCIRNDPFDVSDTENYARFKEVMTSFSPSGYISAAIRSTVYSIPKSKNRDKRPAAGGSAATHRTSVADDSPLPAEQDLSRRWVYEVGICTLEELFSHPHNILEKRTAAFRSLLREVKRTCSLRAKFAS
jgi:hypothetical protein